MNAPVAFAADLLVRATLLILLAWLAASALRAGGASAAVRHLAWLWAVTGLLMLPLLMAVLPRWPVAVLAAAPQPEPVTFDHAVVPVVATAPEPLDWTPFAAFFYLIVAIVLIARLVAARARLGRMWRASEPADSAWSVLLARVGREAGLKTPVELRFAGEPVMPMTWGTRAPKILLPADARSWEEAKRRIVLLHELAHVRRRDSLTQSAGVVACALYWVHPGAWLAARELRLEQELAADELALRAGVPACGYAQSLLDLAGSLALPAPAMAGASQLERRLVALVGRRRRRAPGPVIASLTGALALLATACAATLLPVPVAAERGSVSLAAPAEPPATAAATGLRPDASEPAAEPAFAGVESPTGPPLPPLAAAAPVQLNPLAAQESAFERQSLALQSQEERLQRQAIALEAQTARLEDRARTRGDSELAGHLADQRRAYRSQAEAHAQRRRVLADQREVHRERAEILARRPALEQRRAEAARLGQPVPPFEALPAVPSLPAVPPIPPIPPSDSSK